MDQGPTTNCSNLIQSAKKKDQQNYYEHYFPLKIQNITAWIYQYQLEAQTD